MNTPRPLTPPTLLTADTGQSMVELIAQAMPDLNKAFRRVAGYLVASPTAFMHNSLRDIAAAAQVSEPSVVRFCRYFGFAGVPEFRIALAMSLARAASTTATFLEPGVADKAVINLAAKQAIGAFAATLSVGDRSIILDSGSTSQQFASALRNASPLVVMTTGFNIVEMLRHAPQHTVMMPGGTVRFESNSVSGRLVETTVASMRFDTIYLGADALDPTHGLSTYNEMEAHQNTAMIEASQRVVVLADSMKFRAPALHRICDLDRVDIIVSDTGLPDDLAAAIEARGVRLYRVEPIGSVA